MNNPRGLAVLAIVTLALAIWAFVVARDPKKWRLWWMDIFGVLDVDSTRALRRSQEGQFRLMALILSFLLVVTSLSCSFWTFDAMRELKREKSPLERDQEFMKRYIESKGR